MLSWRKQMKNWSPGRTVPCTCDYKHLYVSSICWCLFLFFCSPNLFLYWYVFIFFFHSSAFDAERERQHRAKYRQMEVRCQFASKETQETHSVRKQTLVDRYFWRDKFKGRKVWIHSRNRQCPNTHLSCWLLGLERGRSTFTNLFSGGDGAVKSYFAFRFTGEKWNSWQIN